MPLFTLGKIVATQGALDALGRSGQSPGEFVTKHARCEWGERDAHDTEANKAALRDGSRILSSYSTRLGDKVWIITEADRSVTTLLLPEEY
ncbi:MAG: hypothetical protein K2V38_26385 [Gemmataceae bacterium]|nr:hypothetical protein [Gemmataceae bacterium]